MRKDLSLLSVVIVNYNGSALLENCVRSVLQSTYKKIEVIIVDNNSKDNSLEIIAEKFREDPRIRIHKNARNVGLAEGANIGISKSNGSILFIMNSDVELDRECIKELVNVLSSDERIGIVGPKVLDYNNRKLIQYVGATSDVYGFPRALGEAEIDKGQYKKNMEVFYVPSLALMVKCSALKRIGLFDSKYFIYWDDLDFCWRGWLSGYSVVAVPRAIAYHVGGVTDVGGYLGRGKKYLTSAKRRYLGERNNLRTVLKNYSYRTLSVVLPRYLSLWLTELVFYLFTHNTKGALALLKALLWNIVELRDTWKIRVRIQYSRVFPDSSILKRLHKAPIKVDVFRAIRTIIVQ